MKRNKKEKTKKYVSMKPQQGLMQVYLYIYTLHSLVGEFASRLLRSSHRLLSNSDICFHSRTRFPSTRIGVMVFKQSRTSILIHFFLLLIYILHFYFFFIYFRISSSSVSSLLRINHESDKTFMNKINLLFIFLNRIHKFKNNNTMKHFVY